jgi:hypothetical protein
VPIISYIVFPLYLGATSPPPMLRRRWLLDRRPGTLWTQSIKDANAKRDEEPMRANETRSQGSVSRALKRWLRAKTQRLLGVDRLQEQLTQVHDCLHASAAATAEYERAAAQNVQTALGRVDRLADAVCNIGPVLGQIHAQLELHLQAITTAATTAAATTAAATTAAPDLTELRSLERHGLFILGCARSGTTILTRSLNRSGDIHLLEEPSYFLHEHITDFVGFFNAMHKLIGNRCLKGTYLPPPLVPEAGPIDMLLRLHGDYQFVGEKTAVGPHDYPPNWAQMYLDFQGKYFLRAKYINILRTPVEAIWSMHKLFPDRPVARLFETWLQAVALSLDAYHVFPNSRVVFFDDLGEVMIGRLSEWLGVPVPTVAGTFGSKYVNSALKPHTIPPPLLPFAAICEECTALYHELRESFCKEQYLYRGPNEWTYFATLLGQLQTIIEKLPSAGSERLRLAA